MKVGVLIQARTRSTRLPEKVLLPFGTGTVLDTVLDRVLAADVGIAGVVTSNHPGDDQIVSLAEGRGIACVRGPEHDVLERYRIAAEQLGLDVAVRITADCPFIWPPEIVRAVDNLARDELHYVANDGCVAGLSVEAMTVSALTTASRDAQDRLEREHVTPWLRRNAEPRSSFVPTGPTDRPDLRWELDTPSDYGLLCALLSAGLSVSSDLHPDWLTSTIDSSPWLATWQQEVVDAAMDR
jgi:spore coat polysaccharide biosynthesis protein SpsF (cytidylyltransferase family)